MRWPSLGFVWITVVVFGAVSFIAWGLITPPLEATWAMTINVGDGSRGRLKDDERKLLQRTLRRHPRLANELTGGRHAGIFSAHDQGRVTKKYAYVVRRDAQAQRITVRYEGVRNGGTVKVRGQAGGTAIEGETSADAAFVWELSADTKFPQLIELRFPGMKKKDAVRIDLDEVAP